MNEVIKINQSFINQETVQTVNARELYDFLEVTKDYTSWIKDQIVRARLVENRDFIVFTQKGVNPSGGRPTSEYHLTLEAGKHVSMMSNTDKGFEVRDYFIACEKTAKQVAHSLPQTYTQALEELLITAKANEQLLIETKQQQVLLETQAPKVKVYDDLINADTLISIDTAAKMCKIKPTEFRHYVKSFVSKFMRQDKGSGGIPTAYSIDNKHMEVKWKTFEDHHSCTVYFTNKGVETAKRRLVRLLNNHINIYQVLFPKTLAGDLK